VFFDSTLSETGLCYAPKVPQGAPYPELEIRDFTLLDQTGALEWFSYRAPNWIVEPKFS
jgi:hypothetical protein